MAKLEEQYNPKLSKFNEYTDSENPLFIRLQKEFRTKATVIKKKFNK